MKRSREPEEEESQDEQDVASVPIPKIVNLDTNGPSAQATSTVIKCSLPGHASDLGFTGYSDYEKHYNNAHTNRCLDCWMNFPSAHILDLHIREHHDALTEIRREKGEKVVSLSHILTTIEQETPDTSCVVYMLRGNLSRRVQKSKSAQDTPSQDTHVSCQLLLRSY